MDGFGINCRTVAENNERFEPEYFGDSVFIVPSPEKVKELTEQGRLPAVKPAYKGADLGEALIRHIQKFFADHDMEEHRMKIFQTLEQRRVVWQQPPQFAEPGNEQ